jgi:protein tyrosine phosphatase (PTP) superfamily phosphohydrolase (DUF442 family)
MRAFRPRLRSWVLQPCLTLLLAAGGFLAWNLATGNFATVRTGRVYRSGQLRATDLASKVRDHRIKTVLNLRGSHPETAWYRAERSATLGNGATQIDMALSSCEWISRDQARMLVQMLDTCEYPVLIHCWRGAERTGLVSAMTELLRKGSTLADARDQFSLRYLFVRAGDGALMRDHLDCYEEWLRAGGRAHTPECFREWVATGYRPGLPCREQWPYDPFPLVVISRPAPPSAPPAASRLAGGRLAPKQ